jgi:iron complex outermembrane receptor protein
VAFGLAPIGVPRDLVEPEWTFGPRSRDHVRQVTLAIAYEGRWTDLVEVSGGLQKSRYRKLVVQPGEPEPQVGRDAPWLYSGAIALHPAERLAIYGSYTTGLEEGGIAPENAANKNAAAPAIMTRQWDAGVRYAISPALKLVAGVFDVRKPYYNLDAASFYRRLGQVRQQGAEVSLAGTLAKGLNVVAGAVFLKPRVTGEEVEAGRIGRRPVGQTNRLIIVSADYELPMVKGVSVNTLITSVGDRMASSDNQLAIPARMAMDLGARYRFKVGGAPATLSARVNNIFNKFGWRTNQSAVFVPLAQRRLSVTLAADL